MHIDLKLDHLLPSAERQAINELSDAVYPPGVMPDWGLAPIEWAPQTVRAMLWEHGQADFCRYVQLHVAQKEGWPEALLQG